tara:strand:- start:4045 stop:5493 length:1449 start_codon:yes stop_codon:yes gene_type:complete
VNISNSYLKLPEEFYEKRDPTPVSSPSIIVLNQELAKDLKIKLDERECVDFFSGNKLPSGSEPIALCYAGHQFGNFVPQLGDGRAILLGEITANNVNYDIQLKGSGITKFSRQGDGRSALRPVLREYIISEAMHTLGIPTTRALAAVSTGDEVIREKLEPGGILTRIAKSHLRVGTFEYFASRQDWKNLKILADYAINRHYPDCNGTNNPYLSLLEQVAEKQSKLIAKWMSIGFIHGVMNTDNTSISGETIDYGPCAFLDEYDPGKVFSSIDHGGRYAFGNQPSIASWNIASLAGCLISLINQDTKIANNLASEVLEKFSISTNQYIYDEMCKKLGLNSEMKKNQELTRDLLKIMNKENIDYTLSFRFLSDHLRNPDGSELNRLFGNRTEIDEWIDKWKNILKKDSISLEKTSDLMDSINPIYIPRNHNIERALNMANEGDLSEFYLLNEVLKNPFLDKDEYKRFQAPPQESERVLQTFCGT